MLLLASCSVPLYRILPHIGGVLSMQRIRRADLKIHREFSTGENLKPLRGAAMEWVEFIGHRYNGASMTVVFATSMFGVSLGAFAVMVRFFELRLRLESEVLSDSAKAQRSSQRTLVKATNSKTDVYANGVQVVDSAPRLSLLNARMLNRNSCAVRGGRDAFRSARADVDGQSHPALPLSPARRCAGVLQLLADGAAPCSLADLFHQSHVRKL